MGGTSKNLDIEYGFTRYYYCSPMRTYTKLERIASNPQDLLVPVFNGNAELKLKNEIYTLFRTIHRICIDPKDQISYKPADHLNDLLEVHKKITLRYAKEIEKSKDLKALLDFMESRGYSENYKIEEMKSLVE